jgi:hypothetical protein
MRIMLNCIMPSILSLWRNHLILCSSISIVLYSLSGGVSCKHTTRPLLTHQHPATRLSRLVGGTAALKEKRKLPRILTHYIIRNKEKTSNICSATCRALSCQKDDPGWSLIQARLTFPDL